MPTRGGDVAAAKKRLGHWWLPLQTREFLVPSGRIAAMKLDQDPLKDVRVRGAIAMVDNGREILERNPLAQGKGAPNPVVPAALKEWSVPIKELPPEGRKLYDPPDPAGARQLLTAAGQPGGIRIPVETTAGDGPAWGDAVPGNLKSREAAGIEAEVKVQEFEIFLSTSAYGKFEKMMLGFRGGATAPHS